MSQIASQAGVSKSLLYHYYPSKDSLVSDIISNHLKDIDIALEISDDDTLDPSERLKLLIGIVLDKYRGADAQHKVQISSMNLLTGEQKKAITEIERRIVRRFSSVLRQINPDLDNKKRPLLMPVTMSLFGVMNWMYMWFKDSGQITREDYADVAAALILGGVGSVR